MLLPGTDLALMDTMLHALKDAGLPTILETGKSMFGRPLVSKTGCRFGT